MKPTVSFAFVIALIIIFFTGLVAYPKWKKANTEATISWDVSGYYFYLPAIFIYKDLKQLRFKDDIIQKYQPTSYFNQGYLHKSGNHVLKYSCGMAVQYLPAFLVAHGIANISGYEADGFSRPYQIAISLWSLLIAALGLYYLGKVLRFYFESHIVGISLLLIVIGTNYLNYAAIDGAMTHNYLFTIYALLLWISHSFYEKPELKKAILIGLLIGLAALTRPSEIIALLIPVFWRVGSIKDLKERYGFVLKNISYYILAGVATASIGVLQLFYWKYATGEWLVYSYQEQGFSWLRPHFKDGLFSFRKGWFIYTPMMIFAVIGFLPLLIKKKKLFFPLALFFGVFSYITFAWDIWWYGGSLGQRAMVQSYAVLAFPLSMFLQWLLQQRIILKIIIFGIFSILIYYNLWLTYQAHDGNLLRPDKMTKAYFFKILGKYEVDENAVKLLDTDEELVGERNNIQTLFFEDFEQDSIPKEYPLQAISGFGAVCLSKDKQYSPTIIASLPNNAEWIRVSADFRCHLKEWEYWRMAQLIVRFYNNEEIIKTKSIRIHRFLKDGQTKTIFLDSKIPKGNATKVDAMLWNSDGQKNIMMDNLRIESFQ